MVGLSRVIRIRTRTDRNLLTRRCLTSKYMASWGSGIMNEYGRTPRAGNYGAAQFFQKNSAFVCIQSISAAKGCEVGDFPSAPAGQSDASLATDTKSGNRQKQKTEPAKPCVNLADHLRLHTTRFFLVLKYRTPSREKNYKGACRKIVEIQRKTLIP